MFLGYIRDTTSHDILTSLGIYNSADTTRDATRAVVWKVGAEKPELVEFDGASSYRSLVQADAQAQ
jgi:protein disulfide-isomerase A6